MRFLHMRRRRWQNRSIFAQMFAMRGYDIHDDLVLFRFQRLSWGRHTPFKELPRAIERRKERRFVRRDKTSFIHAA
jgi:hypothetical protein